MIPSSMGAILLAAGGSRRMQGDSKVLRTWRGSPLVRRQAQLLVEAGLGVVVVVTGASHDRIEAALTGLPVTLLSNERWEQGMGTSISLGIRHLDTQGVSAALVFPCDLPLATVDDVRVLCEACADVGSSSATRMDESGLPGAPAVFGRIHFPLLSALSGDEGARQFLSALRPVVIDRPALTRDADSPEAWARLEEGST